MTKDKKMAKRDASIVEFRLKDIATSLQSSGWQASSIKAKRYVCSGVVRSTMNARIYYPMILDLMSDGVFASATYPRKISRSDYPRVCEVLNKKNYTMRYGKFIVNDETMELKFRFFRSAADVRADMNNTLSVLTSLPARMLDSLSPEIKSYLEVNKEMTILPVIKSEKKAKKSLLSRK